MKDETISLQLLQLDPVLLQETKINRETKKKETQVYHIDHNSKGRLGTLFTLPLTQVSANNRKRIGPPPHQGELDLRPIWNPKIVLNENIVQLQCEAFTVTWPKDGTELAGKRLTLYYAPSPALVAFPYWIEIPTAPRPTYIHTVNSTNNSS